MGMQENAHSLNQASLPFILLCYFCTLTWQLTEWLEEATLVFFRYFLEKERRKEEMQVLRQKVSTGIDGRNKTDLIDNYLVSLVHNASRRFVAGQPDGFIQNRFVIH